MKTIKPTSEQQAVLEAVSTGDNVKVRHTQALERRQRWT